MSIYIYFENESTWPVSPETLTVHAVTQLWGGHCFASDQPQPSPAAELGSSPWSLG